MKKLFSAVFVPRIPEWSAEEAARHTQPIASCSSCNHALCSCGNCHSQRCAQPCLHTDDIAFEYNTELDVSEDFRKLLENRLGE